MPRSGVSVTRGSVGAVVLTVPFSDLHLLFVVHSGDSQHTLGDEVERAGIRILSQGAHVVVLDFELAHDLVEDVVIPLDLQLEGDT